MIKLNKGKQHLKMMALFDLFLSLTYTNRWLILCRWYTTCTYMYVYTKLCVKTPLSLCTCIYVYVYKDKCEKTNVKVVSQWARLLCIDVSYQFLLTFQFCRHISFLLVNSIVIIHLPIFIYVETHSQYLYTYVSVTVQQIYVSLYVYNLLH